MISQIVSLQMSGNHLGKLYENFTCQKKQYNSETPPVEEVAAISVCSYEEFLWN